MANAENLLPFKLAKKRKFESSIPVVMAKGDMVSCEYATSWAITTVMNSVPYCFRGPFY